MSSRRRCWRGRARPSKTAFVRSLDELWQRRLVREQGSDAYDFSHDTIREVAYLALGPVRRRQQHLRVARALERVFAHDPGPVSGQLADHYDRAGAANQAVTWYGRAAALAQQLHASDVAVRLLDRALDLLRTLPGESRASRARTRAARRAARRAGAGRGLPVGGG